MRAILDSLNKKTFTLFFILKIFIYGLSFVTPFVITMLISSTDNLDRTINLIGLLITLNLTLYILYMLNAKYFTVFMYDFRQKVRIFYYNKILKMKMTDLGSVNVGYIHTVLENLIEDTERFVLDIIYGIIRSSIKFGYFHFHVV